MLQILVLRHGRRRRHHQAVTIAAINGDACGGGGLGLAMACDMRISVRKARFWMVPMMLDVIQDFGLSWLMQRQIGVSRTMQMAVLGSPIPAEQGLSWGLLNELVEDQPALEARMDALAQHLGSMGSDALRMLKLLLDGEEAGQKTAHQRQQCIRHKERVRLLLLAIEHLQRLSVLGEAEACAEQLARPVM